MRKIRGAGRNMKGSIGTSTRMVGESISSPYWSIDYTSCNKAKQILQRKEHIKNHMHLSNGALKLSDYLSIFQHAAKHKTAITPPMKRVIHWMWHEMARAGELRGLWKPKG